MTERDGRVTTCCFGEKWQTCLSASVRLHGLVWEIWEFREG